MIIVCITLLLILIEGTSRVGLDLRHCIWIRAYTVGGLFEFSWSLALHLDSFASPCIQTSRVSSLYSTVIDLESIYLSSHCLHSFGSE
jgi:hypothetical protein